MYEFHLVSKGILKLNVHMDCRMCLIRLVHGADLLCAMQHMAA